MAIANITTDADLQARQDSVLPFKHQDSEQRKLAQQIVHLTNALNSTSTYELEPIWLAKINGVLSVVDGHHRLKAYRRVNRKVIPARIIEMTKQDAFALAQCVNCTEMSVPMHNEQKNEAIWQYMLSVSEGDPARTPVNSELEAMFGASPGTLANMRRKIAYAVTETFPADAVNSFTGFPPWKLVRGSGMVHDMGMDTDMVNTHRAARALGKLLDKLGMEYFTKGLNCLRKNIDEYVEGNTDELSEIKEAVPEAGLYDYNDEDPRNDDGDDF